MNERVGDRLLTNKEVASILRTWTFGEIGTISASVGILAQYLASHSELQAQLRSRPDLIPPAIEEILRIHGPLGHEPAGRTTRPVEVGGKKNWNVGERVSLNWISAKRDEAVFDEPEKFRLDLDPA